MGTASILYRIILLAHIGATVVGFGGLITASLYNARSFKAAPAEAAAVLKTTSGVSKIAEFGIYAILPLGIVLVAISDSAFSFAAPWISAAFVVWFLVVGCFHGLVRPAVASMLSAANESSADVLADDDTAQAAAKKLAIGEAVIQLLLVVSLVLMIWQPGGSGI